MSSFNVKTPIVAALVAASFLAIAGERVRGQEDTDSSKAMSRTGIAAMRHAIDALHALQPRLRAAKTKQERKPILAESKRILENLIDVEAMGRLALPRHWEQAKTRNQGEFTRLFDEIMSKKTIPDSVQTKKVDINFVRETRFADGLLFQPARSGIKVFATVPAKDFPTHLDFALHQNGGRLKIYDVYIEGSSTILDYRNRFNAIIQKEGFDGLLKRLRAKAREAGKP